MNAKIIVNKEFKKGKIDERIYGSFVEHMGRVVYSGIYEPGHPKADENGFRLDVLEWVRKMGVTTIRYPGGNFVSCYDWRDGVGPVEKRPHRLEIAWRAIETNEFGTNEFMKWANLAGIEPIFAVNLGTKGIENAVSLVEYCNIKKGTYYSNQRREHGVLQPYGIKTWCLGNEMDGDWQIGHKTADEYGRLAQETAKAMKQVDDTIKVVSCGSSKSDMATYPDWEATTLSYTYDYVDYISLHQYYGNQEKGTRYFLAQSLDMENYIKTVIGTCDFVKAKKRSKKELCISFDEWGVWSVPDVEVASQVDEKPWQVAPHLSEQIYSMEDALLFASMLMNFQKYANRIKIACQSLLTNISAAIMTKRGGDSWVQPIYYPFAWMANYGKGVVLRDNLDCAVYTCEGFAEVPFVDETVVYHEEKKEVVLFTVNRSDEKADLSLVLQGFETEGIIEQLVLSHPDIKMTNLENHEAVTPHESREGKLTEHGLQTSLEPFSFQMIRVQVR